MKIALFMLFLTVNIRNLIFAKQDRIKAWIKAWRLYPDLSAGGTLGFCPSCQVSALEHVRFNQVLLYTEYIKKRSS